MGKNLLKSVKKRATRTIVPRGFDTKYLGEEPTWSGPATEADLGKALNWYNYMVDEKQCREFLCEWMPTQNAYSSRVDALSELPDWKFQGTIGALARMMSRGLTLRDDMMARFRARLDGLLASTTQRVEKKAEPVAERVRVSPDSYFVAEVDAQIDEFVRNKCSSEWSMYDTLKSSSTPSPIANRVAAHFSRLRDELAEAVDGGDDQLREAYRTYSKKQLRAFREFVDKIVTECQTWSGNTKKARAPRKKRVKTADQLTKRVKYLREHSGLKLVSVAPTSIVGARVLWTYNVKTKALARYEWAEGEFEVRGSTLTGYAVAGQKRLRKPESMLPSVSTGGPKAADKAFLDIKTKMSQPNGRLNDQTILLRVVR